MTATGLAAYLQELCATMPAQTLFAVGHDAPDTDAVVSALTEAYRRHLIYGEQCVPFAPTNTLPQEVAVLLGEELAAAIPLHSTVATSCAAPQARFILTDHHASPHYNGRVAAIIDHHLPLDKEILAETDTEIAPVGATTTLVALRCRRDGLTPDAALARMMLGGILADTEGLSPAKARPADREAADWLAALWGGDTAALFYALRAALLGETDLETLYRRDYRRYDTLLGFAVLKIRDTATIDEAALRTLLAADRTASGIAVTLAKISRYHAADGLVCERYLISADPPLRDTVVGMITDACAGNAVSPDTVDLPKNAVFLSRKRLTPILLPILKKLVK